MTSLSLSDRIDAFCTLGKIFTDACSDNPELVESERLRSLIKTQELHNAWFIPSFVKKSISSLAINLTRQSIEEWLSNYSIDRYNPNPLRVGVIMAGNIPLVGFHDFISVLITGNIFVGKPSSKDSQLIGEVAKCLIKINPGFVNLINLTENIFGDTNAIIATGSDNSSRYFNFYFANKPHIFRNNRNSVAIVEDGISDKELVKIGYDVFDYFGLGCRSVSKLYLHENFDIERLREVWKRFDYLLGTTPYRNNLNYQRAILSVEKRDFYDLDNILLIEHDSISSPVSTLYYSRFGEIKDLFGELKLFRDKIQVINGWGYSSFGSSQSPGLSDYQDGVDTLHFLLSVR